MNHKGLTDAGPAPRRSARRYSSHLASTQFHPFQEILMTHTPLRGSSARLDSTWLLDPLRAAPCRNAP